MAQAAARYRPRPATFGADTKHPELVESPVVRTHAQSRAELESPRARVPYLAGYEYSAATVLPAHAQAKYSKRFRAAYGRDRSKAEAPHRTSSTRSPASLTDQHRDAELPSALKSVADRSRRDTIQSVTPAKGCPVHKQRSDTLGAMNPHAEQQSRQRHVQRRTNHNATAFDPLTPATAHTRMPRPSRAIDQSPTPDPGRANVNRYRPCRTSIARTLTLLPPCVWSIGILQATVARISNPPTLTKYAAPDDPSMMISSSTIGHPNRNPSPSQFLRTPPGYQQRSTDVGPVLPHFVLGRTRCARVYQGTVQFHRGNRLSGWQEANAIQRSCRSRFRVSLATVETHSPRFRRCTNPNGIPDKRTVELHLVD